MLFFKREISLTVAYLSCCLQSLLVSLHVTYKLTCLRLQKQKKKEHTVSPGLDTGVPMVDRLVGVPGGEVVSPPEKRRNPGTHPPLCVPSI